MQRAGNALICNGVIDIDICSVLKHGCHPIQLAITYSFWKGVVNRADSTNANIAMKIVFRQNSVLKWQTPIWVGALFGLKLRVRETHFKSRWSCIDKLVVYYLRDVCLFCWRHFTVCQVLCPVRSSNCERNSVFRVVSLIEKYESEILSPVTIVLM